MLSWLDAHAGVAMWLAATAVSALAVLAGAALGVFTGWRSRQDRAALCAARHPIQALAEAARSIREMAERPDGLTRMAELVELRDGSLAQRIRDVRALSVGELPTPRAIEAVYQGREAAAALMVWLEQLGGDPGHMRLRVQTIWKALHDAAGNLDRDIAALDTPRSAGRRR